MSSPIPLLLRLGARGSLLSRMQSGLVASQLEKLHPGLTIELVIIRTSGDRIADRPLHEFGGKGLFTKELELALLDRQVDFAVHSFKDVPVTMPLVEQGGLITAAVPKREDPRDVLLSAKARSIAELPKGARVGTGSLRRQAQLLGLRPDLIVEMIRGNVDTRLKKLRAGEHDAVLLALAGLRRSGLFDASDMVALEPDQFVPSAGQGALSLQCRKDDSATIAILKALDDPTTGRCVAAEREIVRLLSGDCHSPIAAYATLAPDSTLTLSAAVGARNGQPPILRAIAKGKQDAQTIEQVHARLVEQGVVRHLHG